MKAFFTLALTSLAVWLAAPAMAETAAEKGLRIAKSVEAGESGFNDHAADGEMILATAGGNTATRRFDTRTVDTGPGSSRSLLIFRWPGDIDKTTLLTHSYDGKTDDQWLYLPAVGQVRRISSSARSGSFVGSEFAYEDMADQDVEAFTYLWINDEGCPGEGGTCHVVDRRPKERSGYSVQRVWVDTADTRIRRIAYFDRRGAHLKTLDVMGYRQYQGQYWRPNRMVMTNHLTGKRTTLTWTNHRFNVGANPNEFTTNALRRIR